MFALIAGAVFADTAIGGAVETRFWLAKQDRNKKADGSMQDLQMGGTIGAAQLQLSGSNTEGTLGGMFKFKSTKVGAGGGDKQIYDRVFVWWKPIEQIKIFLGIDQDGLFDTASIVSWGFHAGDNDYIFNHMWDHWRAVFPGNWDGFGLALSFYPIPGFDINVVIPTGKVSYRQDPSDSVENLPDISGDAGVLPGRLRLQMGYALDAGKISLVYNGGLVVNEKGGYGIIKGPSKDNNGQVAASFLLTALEGMQILIGGSVILDDPDMIISAGLGFVYNGDGFGVKVRGSYMMCGDLDPQIIADILPFFAVGDKGQVLVNIGITSQGDQLGWSVIPCYRLGMEGGAFKIGLNVYNNTGIRGNQTISKQDYVKWNIPMLLAFNF